MRSINNQESLACSLEVGTGTYRYALLFLLTAEAKLLLAFDHLDNLLVLAIFTVQGRLSLPLGGAPSAVEVHASITCGREVADVRVAALDLFLAALLEAC